MSRALYSYIPDVNDDFFLLIEKQMHKQIFGPVFVSIRRERVFRKSDLKNSENPLTQTQQQIQQTQKTHLPKLKKKIPKTRKYICKGIDIYLNGGKLLLRKLLLSDIITYPIINQALTNLPINQTTPYLVPVLSTTHPLLQPVRVIPELVLLIPFARHHLPGPLVGDREREYGKAEQEHDEEEHDEEVEPEEPGDAATGAEEAGEGDDHEEDAEGDGGALEEFLALGGGLAGEPDAGAEDGDGEEEGYEV